MTVRIIESIRREITRLLLNHRFDEQMGQLEKAEHILAKRAHHLRYTSAVFKQMEAVPSGWMPTATDVRVKDANGFRRLRLANPLPIQEVDKDQWVDLTTLKGPAAISVATALATHEKACKELGREKEELRRCTMNALAAFHTLKALLLAWPEIEPFTDALGLSSKKKSLPAVIPASLNANLNLPVKKAA